MSSMFGDVLGSVISSALQGGQGAQGAGGLGGMLGGALSSALGGAQQGGGGLGGLGGMLGGMLGGGNHSQGTQQGGNFGGLGGAGGGAAMLAALLPMAFQLIQSQGGLSGLAAKFQNAGMGDRVKSWVGTGANQDISGDNVAKALGGDTLAQMAQQLGLPQDKVASSLAEVLPEIVNQMTPHGNVPDNHNEMLAQGISALSKMFA